MGQFSDLPLDILVDILPYLEPVDFLNLCSTCRDLAQPSIRNESSYWSNKTRDTFRVPNRPVAQSDGLRWQRLYKRLRTQSRVYTWGQNANGCLGRGLDDVVPRAVIPRRGMAPRLPRTYVQPRTLVRNTWPEEMDAARGLGVVADLQCGGWSTSLLTDRGIIYTVGLLNGITQYNAQTELRPLRFPVGYPQPGERFEPHTAIKQFSSGRTHILGLSDDGTIWTWCDVHRVGMSIQFTELNGTVKSVVAGWSKSSAYIKGYGIILWDIWDAPEAPSDVVEPQHWTLIPSSGYRRSVSKSKRQDKTSDVVGSSSNPDDNLGDTVGEVTSYIVLEHFVVFVTDLRKTFGCRIRHDTNSGPIHNIFELPELSDAKDVQGSFRTFATFKGAGEVLIADQDYLDAYAQKADARAFEALPPLTVIPALQNTGVVQVAFGDYHYHALHSDGSVSSYGVEPGDSGALGLGGSMDIGLPHGMLRGINYIPWNRDGVLLPHAYTKGRRIWFQKENETWIRFLAKGAKDEEEAKERTRLCGSTPPVQAEVSEWVEQMGSGWDKRPEVQKVDEDGLGAHFALSVAAAGWHSGALVLVNDKVVEAVRKSCLIDDPDATVEAESSAAASGPLESMVSYLANLSRGFLGLPTVSEPNNDGDENEHERSEGPPKGKKWIWSDNSFPRLRLDHGVEMPGDIEFSEWKEEKPSWSLMWRGDQFRGKVFGVSGWEKVNEGA